MNTEAARYRPSALDSSPEEAMASIMSSLDWLEANPSDHIRKAYARTKTGAPIAVNSPEASCFCAVGRIMRDAGLTNTAQAQGLLRKVGATVNSIIGLNDLEGDIAMIRTYVQTQYIKTMEGKI